MIDVATAFQKYGWADQITLSNDMPTYSTRDKAIISGNVVEIMEFESEEYRNTTAPQDTGLSDEYKQSEEYQLELRKRSLRRSRSKVKRLINANPDLTRFATLTFENNVEDLDVAHDEYGKFMDRLRYWAKKNNVDMKYLTVVEFQKRGAVHYHLLLNFYIDKQKLGDIWGNGFVDIKKIDDVGNRGNYMTKYMTKIQTLDQFDSRLEGRKTYFCSRNVQRPQVITGKKNVDKLREVIAAKREDPDFEYTFQRPDVGNVIYKQFVLEDSSLIDDYMTTYKEGVYFKDLDIISNDNVSFGDWVGDIMYEGVGIA